MPRMLTSLKARITAAIAGTALLAGLALTGLAIWTAREDALRTQREELRTIAAINARGLALRRRGSAPTSRCAPTRRCAATGSSGWSVR